jgi:hypothetical protein
MGHFAPREEPCIPIEKEAVVPRGSLDILENIKPLALLEIVVNRS